MRTPILPLDSVKSIIEEDEINSTFFDSQWKNPIVKEAIFLASPYLHKELSKWVRGEITDLKKRERLKLTFLKYIIRASTRCTPFGLFSGISIGQFLNDSKISLSDNIKHKRHTRLDMNYVTALLDSVEKETAVRKELLYFPNSTLFSVANQYRYIEYKIQDNERQYSLEAIEKSPYIDFVLKSSIRGKQINQLVNSLIDEDITKEDAADFINELIDNQILISELELSVSGDESFEKLLSNLKKIKCDSTYKKLTALKSKISLLDEQITNTEDKYAAIYESLEKINVRFNTKYVLQTDFFISTEQNTLHTKYGNLILKVLPLLCKINNHNSAHENLRQFKRKFIARYETKEVSLAHALDIETGIGYIQNNTISNTVPFLDDILPSNKQINTSKSYLKTKVHDFLHHKLQDALSRDVQVMELTDEDFLSIDCNWEKLPKTFSALLEITTIEDQDYIILNSMGGTNAANLLSRFCYGDEELKDMVKNICTLEQELSKDKLLTEIVHLPEARVGNILQRPHLRNYEIPYLGKSNLPISNQININDITITVKNGEIILRSKALNKELSPRLTNAHNYSNKSLPIYHFLCDLQSQNTITNFGFSWFFLNDKYTFLPRVVYKNIVLSKAKWNIQTKEFLKAIDTNNDILLMNTFSIWKELRKLPKLVQLKEGDNLLLINLENKDTVKLLLQQIKSKKEFILEEFLMEKSTIVKQNQKDFANQFVVVFNEKN